MSALPKLQSGDKGRLLECVVGLVQEEALAIGQSGQEGTCQPHEEWVLA